MANLLKLLEPLLTITETDTSRIPLEEATTHSEQLKCEPETEHKAPKSSTKKSDFGRAKPSLKKKIVKKKKEDKGKIKKTQNKKKKQNKITKKNFL